MAWATKYRAEFYDDKGVAWKIDIEEDAFGGAITTLKASGVPLAPEWNNDSDDVFDPIKASRANITLQSITDFSLIDLYSTEDLQFRVKIYENEVLYWMGYIITGSYGEPYECPPYPVNIAAWCGLEHLRNILYDDAGTPYNGRRLTSQVIIDILGKIGYTGFREYVNIYDENMNTTVDDSPFNQALIDVDIFAGKYCDEVLQDVLKPFNACIVHRKGEFVIYRPVEFAGATVYGRIFTSATVKNSTSFTSVKYINRSGHATAIHQMPGGALMVQRPAKKVIVHHDYGNKVSWLDNYKFKGETYDGSSFEGWTSSEAAIAVPIGNYLPGETDGAAMPADTTLNDTKYIRQVIGEFAVIGTGATLYGFEYDYLLYNYSGGTLANVGLFVKLVADGTPYYLVEDDGDYCIWRDDPAGYAGTGSISVAIGSTGWISFKRKVIGLPAAGSYTFTFVRIYSPSSTDIIGAIKNVRFYETSDEVAVKKVKKKLLERFLEHDPRQGWFKGYGSKYKTVISGVVDNEEIIEHEYIKENSINGIDIDRDYVLGDVTDTALDNVVEQFAGALATWEKQLRVDTVTLTGTGGSAVVTCSAEANTAVWDTNLPTTAAAFVTDYAANYAALDITLTSSGADLIFTSDILGMEFDGDTTVVNSTGDLAGTVDDTTPARSTTVLEPTAAWNTRSPGGESKPLLEIIGDEIAAQYARPKELIQMSIAETGSAASVIDPLAHYEDDLRQIGGNNRKYVFNRAEYDARARRWMIDLCEVI